VSHMVVSDQATTISAIAGSITAVAAAVGAVLTLWHNARRGHPPDSRPVEASAAPPPQPPPLNPDGWAGTPRPTPPPTPRQDPAATPADWYRDYTAPLANDWRPARPTNTAPEPAGPLPTAPPNQWWKLAHAAEQSQPEPDAARGRI
jgi:hypothetical protein